MPLLVMNGLHQKSVLLVSQMLSDYYMNLLNYLAQLRDILTNGGKTEGETVQENLQEIQEDSDDGPTR